MQARPVEPDDEDAALRWAGDEEQGRIAPTLGGGVPEPEHRPAAEPESRSPHRGAALTAVFAVLYLALTVGWVLAVQRTSSGTTSFATELLWQFGEFLAIVAAPLWFVASIALTRDAAARIRAGWLALGVGVLVPWPLLLGVLAALSTGAGS